MIDNRNHKKMSEMLNEGDNKKIQKYKKTYSTNMNVTSFYDFINLKLREKRMTRKDLAIALGFKDDDIEKKTETLKKIINTAMYTTNKDRIIMICIALNISYVETNYALKLYRMLPLDENELRDRVIIAAIYDNKDIATTNKWLQKMGLDELSFYKDHNRSKLGLSHSPKSKYKTIKQEVSVGGLMGDSPLLTFYHPTRYVVYGCILLQDEESNTYELSARKNGSFTISYHFDDQVDFDWFKSLDECPVEDFRKYFITLEDLIRRKYQDLFNILDDTKYYHIRFDASFNGSKIELYAETFNYDNPLDPLYFQMLRSGNSYVMTVTANSTFLHKHLSDYSAYYGNVPLPKVIESYTSRKEIELLEDSYLRKNRLLAYDYLQKEILALLKDIKNGDKILYDPSEDFIDYSELANYFGVFNKFEWEPDDIGHYLEAKTNSYNITLENGKTVEISLGLLARAFELGFTDIHDVYKILSENDTLESVCE